MCKTAMVSQTPSSLKRQGNKDVNGDLQSYLGNETFECCCVRLRQNVWEQQNESIQGIKEQTNYQVPNGCRNQGPQKELYCEECAMLINLDNDEVEKIEIDDPDTPMVDLEIAKTRDEAESSFRAKIDNVINFNSTTLQLPTRRKLSDNPKHLNNSATESKSLIPVDSILETQKRERKRRPDWEALGFETFLINNKDTKIEEERVATRSGPFPNTLEFAWDFWLATIATQWNSDHNAKRREAFPIDLAGLCLWLMRAREANEIVEKMTWRSTYVDHQPSSLFKHSSRKPLVSEPSQTRATISVGEPLYGTSALKNPDHSFQNKTHWDFLLEEMQVKSAVMHKMRKWKMKDRANEAGWAKWEFRKRRNSRTEFVRDDQRAWMIERAFEGVDGMIDKTFVDLGYRRRNHTEIGDHWVTGEELMKTWEDTKACKRI